MQKKFIKTITVGSIILLFSSGFLGLFSINKDLNDSFWNIKKISVLGKTNADKDEDDEDEKYENYNGDSVFKQKYKTIINNQNNSGNNVNNTTNEKTGGLVENVNYKEIITAPNKSIYTIYKTVDFYIFRREDGSFGSKTFNTSKEAIDYINANAVAKKEEIKKVVETKKTTTKKPVVKTPIKPVVNKTTTTITTNNAPTPTKPADTYTSAS